VFNYLQLPELDQTIVSVPLLPTSTEFREILQKTQKFRGNGQILWLGSKFHIPWKTVIPVHVCLCV